jgi:hypothetical protein
MRVYDTPGVYDEQTDASSGGIAALRTDVTGFVGLAGRGPLHLAVPIESPRQFEAWFGGPIEQGYLAYCARGFFENGGRRLWAVRVASPAASAACVVVSAASQPAWRIEASSPGVWGNALAVRFVERRRVQRRAIVNAVDTAVLHVDVVTGFEFRTLIECRAAGGVSERSVVQQADPARGTVRLQRPLAAIATSTSVQVETISYTLDVYASGRLVAQWSDISAVAGHPRYGPSLIRQPWVSIDLDRPEQTDGLVPEAELAVEYFRIGRNRGASAPPVVLIRELRTAARRDALDPFGIGSTGPVPLAGGADGLAALTVADFIGGEVSSSASAEAIAAARRGLAALEVVNEISLVAVPDIHIQPRPVNPVVPPPPCQADPCLPGPAVFAVPAPPVVGDQPPRFSADAVAMVQTAAVNQCERLRDRVALLDAPFDACNRLTFAASELREWRMRFDTTFAALYAPWLLVVDPLRGRGRPGAALTRAIPPSGHVAGQCAALDLRSGVHVAPANTPLLGVQAVSLALDDGRHGLLNSMGVNVLRAQSGRGMRVLGARTLSSDRDWRFLNVRRLMAMIEEALDVSLQWAVFEPNEWRTRVKITLVIQSFLLELWRRGAMVGAAPDQAFFVRCDDSNNPPDLRSQGRLQIEVGVAPTVPFEFIVLRIGRDANGFVMTGSEPALAAG